jgi:hypothetical protein
MMNGTNPPSQKLRRTGRGGAEVAERSLSFEEVVAPDFLRVHRRDLCASAVRSFEGKEVSR